MPPLRSADLFDDAFMLMARDGAGLVEIQLRLQKSLAALGRIGHGEFRQTAREQAELALARADVAMALEHDKQRLHALVQELRQQSCGRSRRVFDGCNALHDALWAVLGVFQ